jgi:transposase InsO family protein
MSESGRNSLSAARYLVVDGRVLGWSMRTAMTALLVTVALVMVIWRRGKPDGPLHHSGHCSQYTSDQYRD